eukprot:Awhi_evm1s8325
MYVSSPLMGKRSGPRSNQVSMSYTSLATSFCFRLFDLKVILSLAISLLIIYFASVAFAVDMETVYYYEDAPPALTDLDPAENIYSRYWCPDTISDDLHSPPCWFENICYWDKKWISFGEEAADFSSHTLKVGTKRIDFDVENLPREAQFYDHLPDDFKISTTYIIFKPFNNFLFSLFQLSGLFATVAHHDGFEKPHEYFRINRKLHKQPNATGIRNIQAIFDNSTNLNHEITGTGIRSYRNVCFRKVVVGDMGKLSESIVHGGIQDPKYDFEPGAAVLLKNFTRHILTKAGLYEIDPSIDYKKGSATAKPKASVIDRGNKRAINNIPDVVKLVESYGFDVVVVSFAHMNIEEQIQATRSSALVVGMHGAGLANLMWLRPGVSSIIELFPFGFQKFTYQALSHNTDNTHFWWQNTNRALAGETEYSTMFEKDTWDYYRNLDTFVDIKAFTPTLEKAVRYLKPTYPELKI